MRNLSVRWLMNIKAIMGHLNRIQMGGGASNTWHWRSLSYVIRTIKMSIELGAVAGDWGIYLETRDGWALLCFLQRFIHPIDNNVIVDLLPTTNFFEDVQRVPEQNQKITSGEKLPKNSMRQKIAWDGGRIFLWRYFIYI